MAALRSPVVMIHGNPSWSFYYRRLVEGLRSSYRTIVPDHIGCGLSDKPDDSRYDYILESRIADLEALVEQYRRSGFGYLPYSADHPEFGLTLSSPRWVAAKLEALPRVRLLNWEEGGWGMQDVITLKRHGWTDGSLTNFVQLST